MRLAFSDNGPGPVVVLLHGFPFDRTIWKNQFASIGSTYRLITPDLRGHGSTAAPDGIYTVDEMADDVLELLDDLQIFEPIILGGLSMGGYIALSIVVRYPHRVKGLVLVSSRASTDSSEAASSREKMAAEIEETGQTGPFLASILPKLFARKTFESHPEVIASVHSQMSRMTPRAIVGTLRGLAVRPDRTAELPRILTPTLVLSGSEDQLIPFDESERMASLIPNGSWETISSAGHLGPLENPVETDDAIMNFLKRLHG